MDGDDWIALLGLVVLVAALLCPRWPGDAAHRSPAAKPKE
jgi:hypothetical protein